MNRTEILIWFAKTKESSAALHPAIREEALQELAQLDSMLRELIEGVPSEHNIPANDDDEYFNMEWERGKSAFAAEVRKYKEEALK